MNKQHFESLMEKEATKFHKLVRFLKQLSNFMPLEALDTNAWDDNLAPGVYVHGKKNTFKIRRYCRTSEKFVQRAVKFHNEN